jgi:hypothetical protein
VAGYFIDPTTSLPIVPEAVGGPWWWVDEPALPLDPSLRFSSDPPRSDAVDPRQERVSLLVQYRSHEAALAVGEELAAAVGDPPAEAAWLAARDQAGQAVQAGEAGQAGFDYLGPQAAITPFVQVIDRWLIVSELAYRAEYDPGAGPDGSPRYRSPLALALAATADALMVEESSSADKFVAFDLVCRGDPGALITLSQDLADNGEIYDMQPVWLDPGINDDQRRARRTLRLLNVIDKQALAQLASDPEYRKLANALQDAGKGGATATEEVLENVQDYVEGWVLGSRPDLGTLPDFLDATVLETSASDFARRAALTVLAGSDTRPRTVASGQYAAAPFGAHDAPIPWIMGDAVTYTGLDGDQMTMSLSLFNGVAAGLGPLVDYITDGGCGDIRVAFNDYGYGVSLQ